MTCLASPPMYWVDFDFWIFSFESFISRSRLSTSILVTITLACTTDETKKKKCTLFECRWVKCKSNTWRHLMFMSPDGDSTAILSDHLNHVKVNPFAGKSQYLHFSVISRPWVLAQAQELKPRSPAPTVKCSTDWAYPVAVKTASVSQHQNPCTRTHQSTRFWVCPIVCLFKKRPMFV